MAVTTIDQARAQRAKDVENAIASVRLEGLEPSGEAKDLFQRYVDGDLTSDQLDHSLKTRLDAKYGPVCLPRDERT